MRSDRKGKETTDKRSLANLNENSDEEEEVIVGQVADAEEFKLGKII